MPEPRTSAQMLAVEVTGARARARCQNFCWGTEKDLCSDILPCMPENQIWAPTM